MRARPAAVLLALALAATGTLSGAPASATPAVAAPAPSVATILPEATMNGEAFDPGNIISDSNFYDSSAMTASQIQSFLEDKSGTCRNGKCLDVVKVTIPDQPQVSSSSTGNLICKAMTGGTLKASTLIYRVQKACGISAKVLLVTLQKEQGLVTSTAPSAWALQEALGMACPDTAPCNTAYAGFASQVYTGAKQLKIYKASAFGKQPGKQAIRYSPKASCGSKTVTVETYGTAALYNYTPYTPNSAALSNLHGIGNSCSAYGNRNFWVYYNEWFGSPIDIKYAKSGSISISGSKVSAAAGDVETVKSTGWSPTPTSYTYQWYLDGVAISGATGSTYTLLDTDIGHTLTVKATANHAGRIDKTVTSGAIELGAQFDAAPAPKITGSTRAESTLTADPGTWSPAPDTETITWLRDGKAISGATGLALPAGGALPSYTTTVADRGHAITAAVTAAKAGYFITTMTSKATATILAQFVTAAPHIVLPAGATQPTVGQALGVDTTGWTGDGTALSAADFTYQWIRAGKAVKGATKATYTLGAADAGHTVRVAVTGKVFGFASASTKSAASKTVGKKLTAHTPVAGGVTVLGGALRATIGTWTSGTKLAYQWYRDGVAISKATAAKHTMTDKDLGHALTVKVTGTKSGYTSVVRTSASVGPVARTAVAGATPAVSGTKVIGSTLTAKSGSWTDGATLAYQWYRSGSAISGATAATYALVAADYGKTITVAVTGSMDGKASRTVASKKTAKVLGQIVPPTTGVHVSVPAKGLIVGQKVDRVRGTWSSVGGSAKSVTYRYHWYRNGKAIKGATGASHKLVSADVGKRITVKVTASRSGYKTVSRTSAATGPVAKRAIHATTPTIGGHVTMPDTVTALPGAWEAGAAFSYQWLRDGVAIVGATSASHELVDADLGHRLSVKVTGSKSGLASLSRTSATTATVLRKILPAADPDTMIKLADGGVTVGDELHAIRGDWTLVGGTGTAVDYAYQWFRGGVAIKGADTKEYTLVTADVGSTITVRITGSQTGYRSVTVTSTGVGPVVRALTADTPTIDGDALYPGSLTVDPGTWTKGVAFAYQWLRDGAAITGATGPGYSTVAADLGHSISVTLTGSKGGYETVSRTSAGVGPILRPIVPAAGKPTINAPDGAVVGKVLTRVRGDWALVGGPGGTITYRYAWYRDGVAIAGATASNYTLGLADVGASITVRVTASADGYLTVTATSPAMGPVTKG